jgi:hypothetical protein
MHKMNDQEKTSNPEMTELLNKLNTRTEKVITEDQLKMLSKWILERAKERRQEIAANGS